MQKIRKVLRASEIYAPGGDAPFGKSTFYNYVRLGIISPGIRLSSRLRVWTREEIDRLLGLSPLTTEGE